MDLSIIIPVYNGSQTIVPLVDEIFSRIRDHIDFEVVLVNDNSSDNSWEILQSLAEEHSGRLIAIDLARNFGEHNAVMAGYHHCTGKYIVNIDDDFQNPPSEIIKLVDEIKKGHDVVYGFYVEKKHSVFRNLGSWFNDKVANVMLKKPKWLYLSSFRIISRSLLDQILKYDGPFLYIDGLILRSTDRISQVTVEHSSSQSRQSTYTFTKLLRLWSHVFFNFSILPLRVASLFGIIFSVVGFIGVFVVIYWRVTQPEQPLGWASVIVSILIFSGIQLIVLGVIGEYLGRYFLHFNKTPQFVVRTIVGDIAESYLPKQG